MKEPYRKRYNYDPEAREKALLKRLNSGFFGLCYQASKGKIDALCNFLEADKPLTREDKENIAWMIRTVRVDGMPKKRGRRSLTRIDLVRSAASFGARIVDREREQWLAEHPSFDRLPKGMPNVLLTLATKLTEARYPKLKGWGGDWDKRLNLKHQSVARNFLWHAIRTRCKRSPNKR